MIAQFYFSGFIRVHPMYLWLTAVFRINAASVVLPEITGAPFVRSPVSRDPGRWQGCLGYPVFLEFTCHRGLVYSQCVRYAVLVAVLFYGVGE